MPAPIPAGSSVLAKVRYAGGTLFALAQQYLGDATQWDRIAALNGLSDPWLTGTGSLLMPAVDQSASGQVVIPSQS